MLHHWLRRSGTKQSAPTRRLRVPKVEALEERVVLNNHTWLGAVSNLWGDAANWAGGSPQGDPSPDLFFPTGIAATATQNNLSNLFVHSLHFTGAGAVNYSITGNPFHLGGGGVAIDPGVTGTDTISVSITLDAAATFAANDAASTLTVTGSVTNGGHLLTVTGAGAVNLGGGIAGAGGLTKNGTGTLTLSGRASNTYAGTTGVIDGTLLLNKTPALVGAVAVAGPLTIGGPAGSFGHPVVRLGNHNQIADATVVTFADSGFNSILDLNGVSDAVGGLSFTSSGEIDTGPGTLTLGGDVTVAPAGFNSFINGNLSLGPATRSFTINSGFDDIGLFISGNVSGAAGAGI